MVHSDGKKYTKYEKNIGVGSLALSDTGQQAKFLAMNVHNFISGIVFQTSYL